jgi:hypothetical protein
MGAPFEFTFWQQQTYGWDDFWKRMFGIAPWYAPRCDVVSRPLDTARVAESVAVQWPDLLKDRPLAIGASAGVWRNSMPGIPMQRVDPTKSDVWTRINPWLGYEVTPNMALPLPIAGARWVEGHPNIGGAWDRHWIGVHPDGRTVTEVILMDELKRTFAEVGTFIDGKLASGHAVTAARVPLHSHLLKRGDAPHRMALGLTNYGGCDGHNNDWVTPRCGQVFRLSLAAVNRVKAVIGDPEVHQFVDTLRNHGAVVHDIAGECGIGVVADAAWAGSRLGEVSKHVRMSDLELVTADLPLL